MRAALFLLILTLGFMLLTPKGISAEKIDHHGQQIPLSGDNSDCIACHDGSITSDAAYCIRNCNHGTAHSVAKNYPPRGQEYSYAPADSLREKGIQLYDGKTTCLSCHNLKNQEKFHLVIDNRGSMLCFACHVNK